MPKKRTFSNRRAGKDVFYGGRRPEYSFPEIDRPRRSRRERQVRPTEPDEAELEARTLDRTRRPDAVQRAPRTPGEPKARTANGTSRAGTAGGTGKGPSVRAILVLVSVVVVVILGVFFIFIYPSPIKGISPKPGGITSLAGAVIKVDVKNPVKKGQYTLTVDGRDVTDVSSAKGKQVTCNASLADGKHAAKFVLKSSGFMGTRSKEWAFKVDTGVPKLVLTKKTVKAVKDAPGKVQVDVTGKTEPGATVKMADQSLKVDKNGAFTGSAQASESKSVQVIASDPAGNNASTYVVTQKRPEARGAHVSIYMAASDSDTGKLLDLVARTELNALEIDLKDEAGMVGFALDYPLARQANSTSDLIKMDGLVDRLRYRDVYSICRVVSFKDPKLAKARPDLAVHDRSGAPWGKGFWMDPYSTEVWDYNVAVAVAAAKAGFNEVQFDYVRFPSDSDTTTCVYPHQDGRSPKEVISGFLSYAREKLAPYNVFISADLFGLTASSQGEMGIGQNVPSVAQQTDYISPMVYPSHYHLGEYNIKVPENNPADTVYRSLMDFKKQTAGTGSSLRPWLQDFSLKVTYTPDMVRAQIDATEKAGVHEWLLWDPNCTYSESALKPKKATRAKSK